DYRRGAAVSRTSYTHLRQKLASELASVMETAYLLRSPRNAQRLLSALRRARRGRGKPESVEKLRGELGLGPRR
ncbi:MAG: prevent-host-death protein, partial [Bryobacteraceae bacterium]